MDLFQSRELAAAALSTLALFAAQPGPPQSCVTWCEEVDAPYLWVPGDVTAVDGVTSIAATGGTAGRWLLGSEIVSIKPIDGVVDDGARITTILNATDGKAGVRLLRGNAGQAFQIKTSTQLTTRSPWLLATADTVIHMDMAKDASQTHNAFWLEPLADATVTATTLAANVVEGAITLTTHAATGITAGKWIQVAAAADFLQVFKVLSVAGAADPFTITLDCPIAFPFASGATVVGVIPGQNARFEGNGALVTGTGSTAFQLRSIVGLLKGWRFDSDLDWGMGVWDTGARDVLIEDITGTNLTGSGVGEDGCVRATIRDVAVRVVIWGLSINSTRFVTVDNCNIDGADIGLMLGSLLAGGVGVRDGVIVGSTFTRCTTYGALAFDGSRRIRFMGCAAEYNAGSGFVFVANGGATPDGVSYLGCVAVKNAKAGFYFLSGTILMSNCRTESNGAADTATWGGVRLGAVTVSMANHESYNDTGPGIMCYAACVAKIAGYVSRCDNGQASYFGIFIDQNSNATVYVDGAHFVGSASAGGLHCIWNRGPSLLYVSNAEQTGFNFGIRDFEATAVTWKGPKVTLAFAGAGTYNFGRIQLTGAVAVAVPFTNIVATDRVVLDRAVVAGGTGLAPVVTITAGVGFSLTGVLNDQDSYDWQIV